MSFIKNYVISVIRVFCNTFNFKGMTGKEDFWNYFSFMFIMALALGVFFGMNDIDSSLSIIIIGALADFTFLALVVRRLRDAGYSVWFTIFAFLPIISLPVSIIIGLLKTKTGVLIQTT